MSSFARTIFDVSTPSILLERSRSTLYHTNPPCLPISCSFPRISETKTNFSLILPFFLLLLLLLLTSTPLPLQVTANTLTSVTPQSDCSQISGSCTLSFAIDQPGASLTLPGSTWFAGLATSSSSCSLTANVLTISPAAATVQCVFTTSTTTAPSIALATPSTTISGVAFPAKIWGALEYSGDCKSAATTCTVGMTLKSGAGFLATQITLKTTNGTFKSRTRPNPPTNTDFSLQPSVQSTTLGVSPSGTSFQIQFTKLPGCQAFSFTITSSSQLYAFNTASNACGTVFTPKYAAVNECNDPTSPFCKVTIEKPSTASFSTQLATAVTQATTITLQNIFSTAFLKQTTVTPATCASRSDADLVVVQFPCDITLHKNPMATSEEITASLAITATSPLLNGSPIPFTRVFTQPFYDASLDPDCSNPVQAICTYRFFTKITTDITVAFSDANFVTRAGATITCGSNSGPFGGTYTGTTTTGASTNCRIAVPLLVRDTYATPPTPPSFSFKTTAGSAVNIAAIPAYPPIFTFDPISAVIISPSCNEPTIHLCTVSFSHPQALDNNYKLIVEISRSGSTTPVALPVVLPPEATSWVKHVGTTVSQWELSSSGVSFSTITFPKGPIEYNKDDPSSFTYDVKYAKVGTTTVNSPVVASGSTIQLKQNSFLFAQDDCTVETAATCTLVYQSFTKTLSLTLGSGATYSKTTATSAPAITANTYKFSNLPEDGSTISFVFTGALNLAKLPVTPTITVTTGSTTTDYAYTLASANEFEFKYTNDAVFNPQGDCSDINDLKCTINVVFSHVNTPTLITFQLPSKLTLVTNPLPPGTCNFLNIASDSVSPTQTITVTYVTGSSSIDRTAPQLCPFVLTKVYNGADVSVRVTQLMGPALTTPILRTLSVPYQPVLLIPYDSCYTYPQDGKSFKCSLIFGFLGSTITSLVATTSPSYNWLLPSLPIPQPCTGAITNAIADIRYSSTTSQFVIEPKGINMVTFCRADFANVVNNSADYTNEPVSLNFILNGVTSAPIPFTLPAPPLKQPVTFTSAAAPLDPSQPIPITITLELPGIESFTLSDYISLSLANMFSDAETECLDGSNTALIELDITTGSFTVKDAAYTAGATCTWSWKPNGMVPAQSLKHIVAYTGSTTVHYQYLKYPQLTRVIEWSPISETCVDQIYCDISITIKPNSFSGDFQSASIPNTGTLAWSAGQAAVTCINALDETVATLSLSGANIIFKGTQDIDTETTCKLSIPIYRTVETTAWPELTAVGTDATSTYQIELPKMVQKRFISLIPSYCHFNQTCAYSFYIQPDYLVERPMFVFKSPIPGYWAAMDGNICDFTQIGSQIYLRVVSDFTTLSPTTPSICTIVITPDNSAGYVGGKELRVARYHPQDITQVYETDRFAPPDLTRYNIQTPVYLTDITVTNLNTNPARISQALSCTNKLDTSASNGTPKKHGWCSFSIVFNLEQVTRIRFSNFIGFTSTTQRGECVSRAVDVPNSNYYLVPDESLQYLYLTKREYEPWLTTGFTSVYPVAGLGPDPVEYPEYQPQISGGGCYLNFPVLRTLGAAVGTVAYEFLNNPGVFVGSHEVSFPPMSPYGVQYESHHIVSGAEQNWVKFRFNDPLEGSETIFYQRIRLEFDAALQTVADFPTPDPTTSPTEVEDRTIFTQLSCHVVPRVTSGIHPRCTASAALDSFSRANPSEVYVNWSDNASSDTVAGFYLVFASKRPPTIYRSAQMWTFTIDTAGTQTLQRFPAPPPSFYLPQVLNVLPPIAINAWPYYYNAPPSEPEKQIMYFVAEHQSEIEARGTSVRIRINRPTKFELNATNQWVEQENPDATITIQLQSKVSSGLVSKLPIEFIDFVPINGKVLPVEKKSSPTCPSCITFSIIPFEELPSKPIAPNVPGGPEPGTDDDDELYLDFIVKLRYVGGYTSFTRAITESTAYLNISVDAPAPVQSNSLSAGHGSSDTESVGVGVESIISTHAVWTSAQGKVVTYFFDAEVSTFDALKSTRPDAVYSGDTFYYDVTPKPVLGAITAVPTDFTPITYQFAIYCKLDIEFDPLNPPSSTSEIPVDQEDVEFEVEQLAPTDTTGSDVASSNSPCYAYSYIRIKYADADVTIEDSESDFYLSSSPMERTAALPEARLRANHDALVCDTTDIPILFASGNKLSQSTITLTIPSLFSIAPASGLRYTLTPSTSTDTTNSYIITVQAAQVIAIYAKLTCPTSDSVDVTSQQWTYRTAASTTSNTVSLARGYFIYTPLSRFSTQYELTFPSHPVQNEDFKVGFKLYGSLLADYGLYLQAPSALKHQLFDITNYAVQFKGSDGLFLNARLTYDTADSSRLAIIFDREVFLFDKTSWTRTSTPLSLEFTIRPFSTYFNNILSQICYTTQCSTSQVYSLKVVPPFVASWVLRFEQFTNIPSTIILNRDMEIQDYIELTWFDSNFLATLTTTDLDYGSYSFSLVRDSADPTKFKATIAFSRFWAAQTPIVFPLGYIKGSSFDPKMKMDVYSQGSLLTDTPITVSSDEYPVPPFPASPPLPREPISSFSYTPQFRAKAAITFQFTLGRPLLFGQQLIFSPLPLEVGQSVSIVLDDSLATLAATTAISLNTDGKCDTCAILTVAATSSTAVPVGSVITFALTTRSFDLGGAPTFSTISIASQGYGVDSVVLEDYTLATHTPQFPLYETISTVLTKESVTPAGSTVAQSNILCTVGAICHFRVRFQQTSVGNAASDVAFAGSDGRIFLATIDLNGFTVDTTQLPSAFFPQNDPTTTDNLKVDATLYSFNKQQIIFSLYGTGIKLMTGFNFSVRFSASSLDGSARVILRDLNGYTSLDPDFYDSTPIAAPKVYPQAVVPKFFHPFGGAFVAEPISLGIIPSIPYQVSSSTEPALTIFRYSQSLGGLYTHPTFSATSITGQAYPIDITTGAYSTVGNSARAILSFAEKQPADASQYAIEGFLATYASNPYLAAGEPVVAIATANGSPATWANGFQPANILAEAANPPEPTEFVTQIPAAKVPFLRVRGIRAIQTSPSISVLDVSRTQTFNVTIAQKFLDGVKFRPGDTVYLTIPPQYRIQNAGTPTRCLVYNPMEFVAEPTYYSTFATITPGAYSPISGTRVDLNVLDVLTIPDSTDLILETYICPITVSFVQSYVTDVEEWAAIDSETPYSKITFTAASLGTTSHFDWYMPFPVRLPSYSLNFYGVETVGVPGTVEVNFKNVYFSPSMALSLVLPFTFQLPDARSYQCRIPQTDSPIASVAPVGDYTLSLDLQGFYSSSDIICTFSLTPTAPWVHNTDKYLLSIKGGTTATTVIPVTVGFYKTNQIDPTPAIVTPTPIVTFTGDIVTGLTANIQVTGEKMTIIPGDTLSFSIGVSFTETNGSLDVSALYCLSLSGEQVASVKFQYIGQTEFSTSPLPTSSAQGQLGWAGRVQLSLLISSPPSTPWRCNLELRAVTDHESRSPDALLIGTDPQLTQYPQAVSTLILNELVFRPIFTFDMGAARAYIPTASTTYIEFFYNSTDVQVESGLPASVELSLPLSIASTPAEGLICQLNYGKTRNIPFYVTASSSIAMTFVVPTERLIVPTEQPINHVLCLVPGVAMTPAWSTNKASFDFRRALISKSASVENSFDFQIQYLDEQVNKYIPVKSASNEAIFMDYGKTTRVKFTLTAWERVEFLTPSFVEQKLVRWTRLDQQGVPHYSYFTGTEAADQHFGTSFGCSIEDVDHSTLSPDVGSNWFMYWSASIASWITLTASLPKISCYVDLIAKPTALPSKLYALNLNFPNGVSSMYNIRINATPHCWVGTSDFVRTDTLSSLTVECGGLGGVTPSLRFTPQSDATGAPTLNTFASTSIFTMNAIDITANTAITTLNPSCPSSQTECSSALPVIPTGPDQIYRFNWLFIIDSSMPGYDAVSVNTFTITFQISDLGSNPTAPILVTIPLDLSKVPRPTVKSPATISFATLPGATPAPRGKVANFILTVNELPRGETVFTPFISVTDPRVTLPSGTRPGSIFDYFMSPFLGSNDNVGAGAACYDPNNLGQGVFALVSFRWVNMMPTISTPFIAFIVAPDVAAIEKSLPQSHALSFQCVFPLAVVADSTITFAPLDSATLDLIALGASSYPITTRLTPALASALRPSVAQPNFSNFFANNFSGLQTTFSAALIGEYTQTTTNAFVTINLDGFKVYPGDILVLQFVPQYGAQGSESTAPHTPYRLYTPPFQTSATPCFNTFYPSGLSPMGIITALSPQATPLIGQGSNVFALTVATPRYGPYQQLSCQAPITTFAPIGVTGAIYGKPYTPRQFAALQQELRAMNNGQGGTFTTSYTTVEEALRLSTLLPVGFIGEPIQQFINVQAALVEDFNPEPNSPFAVKFFISSSPPHSAVTLRVDMREYSPSSFSGCTSPQSTMSNVRFYGNSVVSDETQLILRIDLASVSEEDTIITCRFTTPNKVPIDYWASDFKYLDEAAGVYTYTPRNLTTNTQIKSRASIPVPIALYEQHDLTQGGQLVSPASKPIQSVLDFGLQSSYTHPEPAVTIPQYYRRSSSNPYIDGVERTQLLTAMARAYGRKLTENHPLYTQFDPSDIHIVSQTFHQPGSTGDVLQRGSDIGTLIIYAAFRGVDDHTDLVTPYGLDALLTNLSGFGFDSSYASTDSSAPFNSVLFPVCAGMTCGGNCEQCPIGDSCSHADDCRAGTHCLILSQLESQSLETRYSQGKCVSESTYKDYLINEEDFSKTSDRIQSTYSSSRQTFVSNTDAIEENSTFVASTSVMSVVVILLLSIIF